MKNFIHKYGHIILWLIFIIFMFISLMVLVSQGIVYALVIFVPSLIFLCPPIIKTRLKKVVLGIFATIVMSFALFGTSRHSAALKEENIRINQEKRKEEQERKSLEEQKRTEEQQKNEEEKKSELAAANKKAETKQKKIKKTKILSLQTKKKRSKQKIKRNHKFNNLKRKNKCNLNKKLKRL